MSNSTHVEIVDTVEYGVMLLCRDKEIADRFDDYLTEKCFVLFKVKMDPNEWSFLFGQASALSRVQDLFDKFVQDESLT